MCGRSRAWSRRHAARPRQPRAARPIREGETASVARTARPGKCAPLETRIAIATPSVRSGTFVQARREVTPPRSDGCMTRTDELADAVEKLRRLRRLEHLHATTMASSDESGKRRTACESGGSGQPRRPRGAWAFVTQRAVASEPTTPCSETPPTLPCCAPPARRCRALPVTRRSAPPAWRCWPLQAWPRADPRCDVRSATR